jgi:hypothetical protein
MIVQVLAQGEDFDISAGARIGYCASWCEGGGPARKYVETV